MKVTLEQLTVFATLCQTLHFTRAAERLGLTQPTVSKEMRTLERALASCFHDGGWTVAD